MKSKKDQIIDYATTLFMDQGFLATSTRQIAKGLGITQPAIYHHFKSKEDIYVEVLRKFTQEIGYELNIFLKDETSPEETLVNMSEFLIENHSMNFSLMMKDMNQEIPKESRQQIFILWNENYFNPFKTFFEELEGQMPADIDHKNVPFHFLRILSSYTDKNINKNNQLPIKEMIHIFFFGIIKNHN